MPAPTPSEARVVAALKSYKAVYPDVLPVLDIDATGRLVVRPSREGAHGKEGETNEGWGDVAA